MIDIGVVVVVGSSGIGSSISLCEITLPSGSVITVIIVVVPSGLVVVVVVEVLPSSNWVTITLLIDVVLVSGGVIPIGCISSGRLYKYALPELLFDDLLPTATRLLWMEIETKSELLIAFSGIIVLYLDHSLFWNVKISNVLKYGLETAILVPSVETS